MSASTSCAQLGACMWLCVHNLGQCEFICAWLTKQVMCRLFHVGCILWRRLLPDGWTEAERDTAELFINTTFYAQEVKFITMKLQKEHGEYAVITPAMTHNAMCDHKHHLLWRHSLDHTLTFGPVTVRPSHHLEVSRQALMRCDIVYWSWPGLCNRHSELQVSLSSCRHLLIRVATSAHACSAQTSTPKRRCTKTRAKLGIALPRTCTRTTAARWRR